MVARLWYNQPLAHLVWSVGNKTVSKIATGEANQTENTSCQSNIKSF